MTVRTADRSIDRRTIALRGLAPWTTIAGIDWHCAWRASVATYRRAFCRLTRWAAFATVNFLPTVRAGITEYSITVVGTFNAGTAPTDLPFGTYKRGIIPTCWGTTTARCWVKTAQITIRTLRTIDGTAIHNANLVLTNSRASTIIGVATSTDATVATSTENWYGNLRFCTGLTGDLIAALHTNTTTAVVDRNLAIYAGNFVAFNRTGDACFRAIHSSIDIFVAICWVIDNTPEKKSQR